MRERHGARNVPVAAAKAPNAPGRNPVSSRWARSTAQFQPVARSGMSRALVTITTTSWIAMVAMAVVRVPRRHSAKPTRITNTTSATLCSKRRSRSASHNVPEIRPTNTMTANAPSVNGNVANTARSRLGTTRQPAGDAIDQEYPAGSVIAVPRLAELRMALEHWYDPRRAESWDAVGLVCGDPDDHIDHVLLAVDAVPATVAEAMRVDAQLLVSHHPLLLTPA